MAAVGVLDEVDEVLKTVLDGQDAEARPWQRFPAHEGVGDKILWKDPKSGSYAGIMGVAPGASLRLHVHPFAVHHMYVLEGTCRVAGQVLSRGSYLFVPPGAKHHIEEAGPVGCTIFFLYLRAPQPTG